MRDMTLTIAFDDNPDRTPVEFATLSGEELQAAKRLTRAIADEIHAELNRRDINSPDYLQDSDGNITCLRCAAEFVAIEDFRAHDCNEESEAA